MLYYTEVTVYPAQVVLIIPSAIQSIAQVAQFDFVLFYPVVQPFGAERLDVVSAA